MLLELMSSNLPYSARKVLAEKIMKAHSLMYKNGLTVGDMVKIPGPIPRAMMTRYSGDALKYVLDENVYRFVVNRDICGNLHWVDITEYE